MESLGGYLNSARKSLFRFEYLQNFSGTDKEAFAHWQKTGKIDWTVIQEWWGFLERKHAEGVTTTRVRLVELPISEYTKFELQLHYETAKHGDDIRIITDNQFGKLTIPYTDFWMIDDQLVLRTLYDEHGMFIGMEKGDEKGYRQAKLALIANSVPIERSPFFRWPSPAG